MLSKKLSELKDKVNKGEHQINGYFDFVVPLLEGFWWQDGIAGIDYAHKENFKWISVIRYGRGRIMASSKEYLDFILEQLSELDDISYRAMMGEYIIYHRGKGVGGIYDDRFLVKPTKSATAMMPNAVMELPYEGAKEMLLVYDVDNKEFLRLLLEAMYEELPAPKKKK